MRVLEPGPICGRPLTRKRIITEDDSGFGSLAAICPACCCDAYDRWPRWVSATRVPNRGATFTATRSHGVSRALGDRPYLISSFSHKLRPLTEAVLTLRFNSFKPRSPLQAPRRGSWVDRIHPSSSASSRCGRFCSPARSQQALRAFVEASL